MTSDPALPKIIALETLLEPSYIDSVGFEQRDGRLRIILSKDLRSIAGVLAQQVISGMLCQQGLSLSGIDHWILHSGGRKVIDNVREALGLTDAQVRHSKCVLKNFGNMSSPTVLFVLDEVLRTATPRPGESGVMLAMGPGLALETALLKW